MYRAWKCIWHINDNNDGGGGGDRGEDKRKLCVYTSNPQKTSKKINLALYANSSRRFQLPVYKETGKRITATT